MHNMLQKKIHKYTTTIKGNFIVDRIEPVCQPSNDYDEINDHYYTKYSEQGLL